MAKTSGKRILATTSMRFDLDGNFLANQVDIPLQHWLKSKQNLSTRRRNRCHDVIFRGGGGTPDRLDVDAIKVSWRHCVRSLLGTGSSLSSFFRNSLMSSSSPVGF